MTKQTEMLKMIQEQFDNQKDLLNRCECILDDSPDGWLDYNKRARNPGFRRLTEEDGRRKWVKIDSRSDEGIKLIKALADKSTARYARKRLRVNVRLMGKLLEKYRVYDPLNAPFGEVATGAVYLKDDICLEEWEKEMWYANTSFEDDLIHDTKAGHKVRSKSEVLIADTLFDLGISYRYDCRFDGGRRSIYPDFEIVRPRDREILIWEHFGRIDDTDYMEKVLQKLLIYGRRGFIPGKNLIVTWETAADPLTHGKIDKALTGYRIAEPESEETKMEKTLQLC